MRRAIQLASLANGYTAPNPRVGAVVVYQDKILGEGYHQAYGQAHAEVNAIAAVKKEDQKLLPKATIYVTLEPCFHQGKTPPCVDLILQHKIQRVVIACTDPYEKVAGQSIRKLKEAGVAVTVGVLEAAATKLARRFMTQVTQQRPYIILKFARSQDGFIGQIDKQVPISNRLSKRLVHKWRAEESAILVGTNTALIDNPRLNNRLYFGRHPLRLVLDRQLRIPTTGHLFDGSTPTWVFTEKKPPAKQKNVTYIPLNFKGNRIQNLLQYLHEKRIQSVLVEGGSQLLQSFVQADLWDECRIFRSPKSLGEGVAAPHIPQKKLHQEIQLADNTLQVFFRSSMR